MATASRQKLIAPCGIDCGICELYQCRSNEPLKVYLLSSGIAVGKIPCEGCRNIEGCCPVISETCATYKCAQQHAVTFCHECNEFPCSMLNPAADRADTLPHNLKVFNQCIIRQHGVDRLIEDSAEIKRRYHKGTMIIGRGPHIE